MRWETINIKKNKPQAYSKRGLAFFHRNNCLGQVYTPEREMLCAPAKAFSHSCGLVWVCVLYCGCASWEQRACPVCVSRLFVFPKICISLGQPVNTESVFHLNTKSGAPREMGSRTARRKKRRTREMATISIYIYTRGTFLFPCLSFTGTYTRGRAHFAARVCSWIPERQFYDSCVCISSDAGTRIPAHCMSPLVRSFYLMQPPGRLQEILP